MDDKSQKNPDQEESDIGDTSLPKDVQVITMILKEMGINEYEPRVINQLLEFTYKYITDVLDDSKLFANHAGRTNVAIDDVKLAIQTKLMHSFVSPPPKEFLLEIAQQKNSTNLPALKTYAGARLPPDRYCLTSINYRLKTQEKKKPSNTQQRNFQPTNRFPMNKQMTPSGFNTNTGAIKRKWQEPDYPGS